MRFAPFRQDGIDGLAVVSDEGAATGLTALDPNYPEKLETLVRLGLASLGLSRKPQLWMKAGDVCEVEIDRLGILRNPVVDVPAVESARQARTYGRA